MSRIATAPTQSAERMVDLGGARTGLVVPLRKEDALLGTFTIYRQRGAAVHRQADRAAAEFRRAGGDRDGECAAAQRIAPAHERSAGVARIPDRDQRRAQGHQPLDLRSRYRAADGGDHGSPAVPRRFRHHPSRRRRRIPLGRRPHAVARIRADRAQCQDPARHRHVGRPRRAGRRYGPDPRCLDRPVLRSERGRPRRRRAHDDRGAAAARRRADRRHRPRPPAGRGVFRAARCSSSRPSPTRR